jgi:hypothetical protein
MAHIDKSKWFYTAVKWYAPALLQIDFAKDTTLPHVLEVCKSSPTQRGKYLDKETRRSFNQTQADAGHGLIVPLLSIL